jgi:sterol desaturase/sphingolipid hydroxylase (fatty acid hydroxylase superfamily)
MTASTLGRGVGTRFGSGWISGVLGVVLSALAAGGVLCLRFPALLTTPDARGYYPLEIVRFLIYACLVAGFGLGTLSLLLRREKWLGAAALLLATVATLLGGATAEIGPLGSSHVYAGLDWFLLDMLVLGLVFIPLERAFSRLREQPIFRPQWRTDLVHFAMSHLLVQATVLLTLAPATLLFAWAVRPTLQRVVQAQPLVLQFVEIVLVADLAQYVVHRTFHQVPWLWRFHAIHHSAEAMDWLAGSRLHLVDIVVTRGLSFVPLYLLGFSPPAVYAYLVFVAFHAVFIHANVRFRFRPIERLVVTPRYHHWHHAAAPEAVDRNFAVHVPILDRLFGTRYFPEGRWPDAYGLAGPPVPDGWVRQLLWPLARRAHTGADVH